MQGKTIVLGVTGGIAAYKSVEIVSRLKKKGAKVHVIMTKHATEFVSPMTFETMSHEPVVTDLFARPEKWEVEHVALAKAADVFVIAPATANILAKMANGIADDMLSTTVLATKANTLVAPAMNTAMWTHPATQNNLRILKSRGVHVVGPEGGLLACGDNGAGRMSEPECIVQEIEKLLYTPQDFKGLKVLVTAGGTREYLDPVRYLSNESSGKMGFAIASAARDRGADVTLVRAFTSVEVPQVYEDIHVVSTCDLYDAVIQKAANMDIVIQAAAPADYRFEQQFSQKLKKNAGEAMVLKMIENPDIAKAVGERKHPGQILVGFAAETEKLTEHAKEKLHKKNLDMIVANDVTQPGAGFNVDTNIATLITENDMETLPLLSKRELAETILDRILQLRNKK